jgi:hypothetical protein
MSIVGLVIPHGDKKRVITLSQRNPAAPQMRDAQATLGAQAQIRQWRGSCRHLLLHRVAPLGLQHVGDRARPIGLAAGR